MEVKNKNLNLEIIKTAKYVKRKYLYLRKGKQDDKVRVTKSLKAVMTPIKNW